MKGEKEGTWFDKKIEEIQQEYTGFSAFKKELKPRTEALKIIMIYLVIGGLWILLSDHALGFFVKDTEVYKRLQTYKGWTYNIITGWFFYIIISKRMILFKKATEKVFEGYEELSATHEELLVMDEELSQQFDELEKHRNALVISEQRYALAVEGANDGIWDWDVKNNIYFVSPKWKDAFGYGEDEFTNQYEPWKQLLHPQDQERVVSKIEEYLNAERENYEDTYRLQCKDGSYKWILSRGKAVRDKEGKAIRVAGSHTDITNYMELQGLLHQEKELYKSIIDGAAVFILGLSTEGKIIEFNTFAESLTGYKKEEVMGLKWFDLFISEEKREATQEVIHSLLSGKVVRNQENVVITKDGHRIDILWNNNVVYDSQENILGIISMGTDITARKAMEKKLFSLAYYDSLTGLPNRGMFEDILQEFIEDARINKQRFGLMYFDLDNFKKINDTLGHSYGDKLLQAIGEKLQRVLKGEQCLSRLSGDEFAVIIPNVMNTIEFHGQIIEIMEEVNKVWIIEENEIYITCSVGIAIYPDDGQDFQTLFKNADTAMYTSKDLSKNCYTFYTPEMNEKSQKFLEMENDLRKALKNNEFQLYYQPLVNLKTGKITGVEALIRWVHPIKGMISPMEFIPFAEETGLIIEIGEYVIEEACHCLKKWRDMNLPQISMAVNLSARQLHQHDLVDKISKIIEAVEIHGKDLVFEITENIALHDLKQSVSVLNNLRTMNIKVALDDFGTGYSSLNYIKRLPIDIIKIDKTFVGDITKHSDEQVIAKTIIDLAHNMNYVVTAEGIETEEQFKILKEYDCDFGQGYLFSRPLPAEEMENLLLSNKLFLI